MSHSEAATLIPSLIDWATPRGIGALFYNLVYSSLTFHYVEDLARLYREIHSSLQQRGKLVFSVEHPICSAPIRPGPSRKLSKKVIRDGTYGH
jgi:SAM-dependent methyltransferase